MRELVFEMKNYVNMESDLFFGKENNVDVRI